MSTYLAYTRATRPTGRLIAQELGLRSWGIRVPNFRPDVLIRWGSRRPMDAARVLNPSTAIRLASDKIFTLVRLEEEGIPHVPFFMTFADAVEYAPDGIILGRTRNGMQGRGISVYDPSRIYGNRYPWCPPIRGREHDFYSIYVQPTREVRVHVVGEEVIRVQGKFKDFPEEADVNPFVRNYKTGYRFRAPRRELRSSRKQWAVRAVKALQLDFGAVDMLLFGEDEECKILEVNSGPACSPLTASCYATALRQLINQ